MAAVSIESMARSSSPLCRPLWRTVQREGRNCLFTLLKKILPATTAFPFCSRPPRRRPGCIQTLGTLISWQCFPGPVFAPHDYYSVVGAVHHMKTGGRQFIDTKRKTAASKQHEATVFLRYPTIFPSPVPFQERPTGIRASSVFWLLRPGGWGPPAPAVPPSQGFPNDRLTP